jgi:hypothetical protein
MQRMIEIFIVITVLFIIIYSALYNFYFDWLCENYSWKNETNQSFAISKLAICKDSVVCWPINIDVNIKNEITDWSCIKKDSPIFSSDLYINIFNHFKNSIII